MLAQEAIEQGKFFYEHSDDVYRENKMAENFIREFDRLTGENVMGIYGGAHTGLGLPRRRCQNTFLRQAVRNSEMCEQKEPRHLRWLRRTGTLPNGRNGT